MFLLTRMTGQSVVIDDNIVATVTEFGNDFANLNLTHRSGGDIGEVTITACGKTHLAFGVYAILVEATDEKIRIGFEGPKFISIHRMEYI